MNFKEFFNQTTLGTENVDSSQIESIYNKAKLSIRLVQLYGRSTQQQLLKNINTVANLSSGVYGMYMSRENRRTIGKDVVDKFKLLFPKDMMINQKLQTLPTAVIKQYFPDIDERHLQPSDTIRVNVSRIVRELGDTKEAIVEIASTIVHEATHELEMQNYGKTDESGPKSAEVHFHNWVQQNWNMIKQRIPEFANM